MSARTDSVRVRKWNEFMKVAHAKWLLHCAQAAACCASINLVGCERSSTVEAPPSSAPVPVLAEQLTAGAEVYKLNCAQCHFAGEGSATAPPLAGSPALSAGPTRAIRIILQGQRNESVVQGQKFNGIMPGMAYLTDEEIASVAVYLRERFGGTAEAVDPVTVAKERKDLRVD